MTLESTAVNFLRQGVALSRGTLEGASGQTIPAIIKGRHRQTSRRLTRKEIIREGKVLKPGKLTYALRYLAGKHVMADIELLQTGHTADLLRQRSQQLVEADIKHGDVLQPSYLRRKTRTQPVVHQDDLIQITHVPDACRQTAMEFIISHNNHRHRRIPKIVRQFKGEAIVVNENSIQGLVKKLRGNSTFKFIESDVQVDQSRQAEDDVRELTGKAIVAQIQLEE